MTPGRSLPLYAGGAFGVCCATACASAGIACTAVAAAATAGNAFIIWRRFMAVSPGTKVFNRAKTRSRAGRTRMLHTLEHVGNDVVAAVDLVGRGHPL